MEQYGSYCDKVETVRNVDELSLVVEDLFATLYDHHDSRAWQGRRHDSAPEEPRDYRTYYTRGSSGAQPAFDPEVRRTW